MGLSGIPLPNIMLVLNPCGPFTSSKARVLRFVSFSPKVKGAMTALITWHDCFAPMAPKNQLIANWISSSHLEDVKYWKIETCHDLMLQKNPQIGKKHENTEKTSSDNHLCKYFFSVVENSACLSVTRHDLE